MPRTRSRGAAGTSDERLIREWMAAHELLHLEVGYLPLDRSFVVVVRDLTQPDDAYVGDGGQAADLTAAILAAIDSAEREG